LLVGLLLVAAWLRLQAVFSPGLHPDEALFGSWARSIGTWQDPWLQRQAVDKPPLFFYLQALFFPLLGTAEVWVLRLVNLLASLVLVPLVVRLVEVLYWERLAAFLAGVLMVFSPIAVQYSPTAFLDPLLTALLAAALLAAVTPAGSPRQTKLVGGVLFGLAVATKYQAWLFLPLLLAIGLFRNWSRATWRSWLVGAAIPLFLLVVWGLARGGTSLWNLQMAGFGGLRPAWSWELWPRLEAWGELWATMLGSPVMAFLALLAVPIFFAVLLSEENWPTAYDQLFVIFVAAYAVLHWFLAVPIWDRYLLPAVPLVALLFGRFVSRVLSFLAPELPVPLGYLQRAVAVAAVLLLLVPAVSAAELAEQPANNGGIDAIAHLLADEPYGTVLYDHWYSWQWRYFLYDSGVYVSWFPHPAALVEDLSVFADGPEQRYLVLPEDERALPVHRALTGAGYALQPEYNGSGVVLYRITGGAR
jgi:4-amino-4-deoxy-L-arabinose transferase-like glycosyltransferase